MSQLLSGEMQDPGVNPGLQLQRNPELPAGWVAFPLASGIGSAYNPVRDSVAAPGTSLGQPSFPLALGFPTAVLGPPALQKAGCLPTPSLTMDQGSVPSKEPNPRSAFRFHASTMATCVLRSSLRHRCSSQARTTPLGPGLGPQATKCRTQGL